MPLDIFVEALFLQQPFYANNQNNIMTKQLIVGLGEALWDVLPTGKKMGGAPANFAYHASQFGLEGIAVSALGDDDLGRDLLKEYAQVGLKVHMQIVDFPTGTVQVTINGEGVPSYDICQGVAWDNISMTPELVELAKRATVVCYGSLAQRSTVSRNTINAFVDLVPDDADHMRVFDINLRQDYYSRELIEENLHKCNVLKINDEEIIVVADLFGLDASDLKGCCKALLKKYKLRMAILTCGAVGSYAVNEAGEESWLDTPKVEVVDTVGAGDAFTGAFIAAILRGKSLKEAHALAVKVSAYVCTKAGAMPVLPEEIKII